MKIMPTSDPEKARVFFEQKVAFTLGPMEVQSLLDENQEFNLIDVRDAEDFVQAHIPTATSLPEENWESFAGLSKIRTNILYGYSGACSLAAKAACFFASRGYPVMEMDGGFDAWEDHDLDVETGFPGQERRPTA